MHRPLPPGFGRFPLLHVDDHIDKTPKSWRRHGGVFLPMYQAEAMWLDFTADYPMAVKVAAGKINALTGKDWTDELSLPQDYLVVPDQPWLDGFSVGEGLIRQFVAMPLGQGYTAEEQLTGDGRHGGLQLIVYPMLASRYERMQEAARCVLQCAAPDAQMSPEMGLAPGGLMRQELFEDDFGFDAWDRSVRSRCFVHVLNSVQFFEVAGVAPPAKPPTAKVYTEAGLPWFDYYGGDRTALDGAKKLAGLDSLAAKQFKKGEGFLADNDALAPAVITRLLGARVREGEF